MVSPNGEPDTPPEGGRDGDGLPVLQIRDHQERIIVEFAIFAKTLMPAGTAMSEAELRDHAADILRAIVLDMNTKQTAQEQSRKSKGHGSARAMEASGKLHADDRIKHGFTFRAVLAEFRALRATVLRLYEESGASDLMEVRRFNEASPPREATARGSASVHGSDTVGRVVDYRVRARGLQCWELNALFGPRDVE